MYYLSVTIARGDPIVAPTNATENAYDISAVVALRRTLRSGSVDDASEVRMP